MGTSVSTIRHSSNIQEQPPASAKSLLYELKDGWFPAGGEISRKIQQRPGRIWTYCTNLPPDQDPTFHYAVKILSSELCFPTDGSYGNIDIMERRLNAFVKSLVEKNMQPYHTNTHDNISALAGKVLFYDYNFKVVDKEDRIAQVFDLTDQHEICGFAFLPAPLKYYPIGKNYKASHGPYIPFLIFAEPEDLIFYLKVDGEDIGFMTDPVNTPDKCFLRIRVKEISDIKNFRKIPILITARKDKVRNWRQNGNELYFQCLGNFSSLVETLSPGKHRIDIAVHFSYERNKVGVLGSINTETKSRTRWGRPKEDRFILGEMESVIAENLLIKCDSDDDLVLSEELCKGSFELIVPEKLTMVKSMSIFHGFKDQNLSDDREQKNGLPRLRRVGLL